MKKGITTIDLYVPEGWNNLSNRQLRFLFSLISGDFSVVEVKTFALLRWNKLKVIGKLPTGGYLLKRKRLLFEVSAIQLAEVLESMSWIDRVKAQPFRLSDYGLRHPLPANFEGVSFESFICCDNLYQGFLLTGSDELLNQMFYILFPLMKFVPARMGKILSRPNKIDRIGVFYWFSSLKQSFSELFPDLFSTAPAESLGGQSVSPKSVVDSMNAQLRALTKGDITKEHEILQMNCHRALTELNSQAREYRELNSKFKK